MKKLVVVLGITLMAMGAAFAETPQNTFRGGLLYVQPSGSEDIELFDYTVSNVEMEPSFGLSLAYEYRFNDMIGLEGGLSWAKHDFKEERDSDFGDESTQFMPLSVALNIHPLKDAKVDFYFGPVLAWVMYDDIEAGYRVGEERVDFKVEADDDIAYGVQLGIDAPINDKGLIFNAALKYMMTKYKADVTARYPDLGTASSNAKDDFEFDVNPLMLQVGLGYRW